MGHVICRGVEYGFNDQRGAAVFSMAIVPGFCSWYCGDSAKMVERSGSRTPLAVGRPILAVCGDVLSLDHLGAVWRA